MRKPIACIIEAIRRGYAQEAVETKETQEYQKKEAQMKEERLQTDREKLRIKYNRAKAQILIDACADFPGWRHELSGELFTVWNDNLKKKDSDLTTYLFPNGEEWMGQEPAWYGRLTNHPGELWETESILSWKRFFDNSGWTKI